jgi:hypothetical protein
MPRPLYFLECHYGQKLGNAFRKTERDRNSRREVVELIRSGEVEIRKIHEVIEPCEGYPRGQTLDVTVDILAEAMSDCPPIPSAKVTCGTNCCVRSKRMTFVA